ncbi:transposon Tf2-1 polyprotein [Tanacetum coccineum]
MDASGFGIGAVLLQDQHPIAFYSHKLSKRLQLASVYVRELHAITSAVGKWRQYLLGSRFIIRTDQKSIRGLLDQVIQTPEQHHYLAKLLGYSYTIEYKPGVENGVADALSRRPEGEPAVSKFLTLSTIHLKYIQKLQELNLSDPFLMELHKQLTEGLINQAHYTVKDGLLLFKGKLLIGRDPHLIQEILREFHCTPVGGHSGVRKTMARVNQTFTWPTMKEDVTEFIKGCYICQGHKAVTTKPARLLQPLPPPKAIWEEITMDFVTGLPPSHGATVIFVVVDRLSKQAHFGTLPTSFTASKELIEELRSNLKHAQSKYKKFADAKRRGEQFNEGDLVLIKLQPHRQSYVAQRHNRKLARRYFGPFLIEKKIGGVAYQVELPAHAKVHNVFHVSLLKRFHSSSIIQTRTEVEEDKL